MAKKSFMPKADADKQLWLQNFANKLNTYAAKYSIAAADITDIQNGSTAFTYWLNYQNQYSEYTKKITQYKNELANGIDPGAAAAVVPVPPTLPAAPTAVIPGIFKRATAIAVAIKSKVNYTEADGKDLGLEGADIAAVDLNNAKPVIQVRLAGGGHPEIVWTKGEMDGIDIYVDRGDGNWQFLATDTYPNYTDTAPLPAVGTAAHWKYRTIYRYDDAQVGQYSDLIGISVAG